MKVLMALVPLLTLSGPGLPAQGPDTLPRKVIHLWVDPHYGDDAVAGAFNPVAPLQPVDVLKPGADVLLHKPWPFKTITQAVNAIPSLPHLGQHAVWEFAIIHLMPGLYKRNTNANGATPVAYLDNGLRGNGESLPIYLPAGVSVQGTSALNTLINVEDIGPAFEFGTTAGPLATGVNTFISGLSIYGADAGNENHRANCAVYIGQDFPASPTLSNCFIFGNGIGVAVDARDDATPEVGYHTPRLINNTLAWNACGLWNGQRTRPLPQGSVGVSHLVLVNNIFDASPPYGWNSVNFPGDGPPVNWNMLGISGFEGVDDDDLVTQVGIVGGDFNAYEKATNGTLKANRLLVVAGGFPVTVRRTNNVMGPQGRLNLAPFTGWNGATNNARGVLYIRDALHNALRLGGGAPTQFVRPGMLCDLSPGDFRLCPNVAFAGVDGQGRPFPPGSTTQGALNPLVDAGFYAPVPRDITGPVFIMTNGEHFGVPGRLPTAAWQFDNWDQDCEGFGNPRYFDHPVYADANPGVESRIDVGADEMGVLIAVGYRFGTTHFVDGQPSRHFTDPVQHSPLVNDNKYVMWFGPAGARNSSTAPAPAGRPRFTYNWPDVWSFDLVSGRPAYWPGKTDVIPHLLPDLHPWWYLLGGFNIPTNCVWHYWSGLHNAWLFVPPIAAVINPPGTSNVLVPGYAWLDFTLNPAPQVFGPFGTPNPINEFGDWCEAHDRPNVALPHWDDLQSILPPANQAVRYSLELPAPTFYSATPANLQSFMLLKVQ